MSNSVTLFGTMFFILIPILLIQLLRTFSIRTNILLEYPDERKQHNHPVPLLGGLVLFISTIIFSVLGLIENKLTCDICFYLVFIIGILDDLFELRYYVKLIMQILVSILYVQNNVIAITDNNTINSIATAVWFVVILNAFNLIDGINGLLIGLSIIYAAFTGNIWLVLPLFVLLFFNMNEKTFMGDSGAFMLAYIFISSNSANIPTRFSALVVFFGYPIYEITSSFLRRILMKKNPFKPDRYHLHYIGSEQFGLSTFLMLTYSLTLGFVLISSQKLDWLIYLGICTVIFIYQLCFIFHTERMLKGDDGNF